MKMEKTKKWKIKIKSRNSEKIDKHKKIKIYIL
jgi:hypothetical protein